MNTDDEDDLASARFQPYFPVLILTLFVLSCSEKKEEPKPIPPRKAAQAPATAPKRDTGLYRSYYLSGGKSLTDLLAGLSDTKKLILYKINRRDIKHLKEGDSVVVPNGSDNEMDYSPFPLSLSDSTLKIIFVDRRIQAFAAYDSGRLVRWGPTSTGKKSTPTPEGLYHTNWKSKETHSTVNGDWVLKWYFNLDNLEGVSLHEYELPGYPASHSCVRLLTEDAFWIYNWADQWKLSPDRSKVDTTGTPVIVYNNYGYGKLPPWKKLSTDPMATTVTDSLLYSVKEHWLIDAKTPVVTVQ
jgi:hypothetical protein